MAYTWEEVKEVFRPNLKDVHWGRLEADMEKCTGCGLCIQNCPVKAWIMDENKTPRMQEGWPCFACYNCMVACPVGAISITELQHVDSGYYKRETLSQKLPLQPQDANGNPDKWNEVEGAVFNRRSVRNFANKPVPEPFIRRVLEAGRHAPTSGNAQSLKFIVITNKVIMDEINGIARDNVRQILDMYLDDIAVKEMAKGYSPQSSDVGPGTFDPRVIYAGMKNGVLKADPGILLGAPVAILLCADKRSIGGPELQIGICGQNMTLVAKSLGLGSCWVGFARMVNMVPSYLEKLGIEYPFAVTGCLVLGYPRFKQEGILPRNFRPITWFREGTEGPEVETAPPIPEVSIK